MAFLDPCRAFWQASLRLPPKSLPETLLWELETYYRLPRDKVLKRCRTATTRIADAWRRASPSTPEDVEAFYRQPLDYPFELLWWHSFMAHDRSFLNVLPAMRWAYHSGARRTLDFGGGVGSHAIVMAEYGLDVTLADVSDELLAFAAWRANRRSVSAHLIHLDREPLDGTYDFIVAADVFEHLPAPPQTLMWLCEHLNDGGLLFINMPTTPSADVPQHISFWGEQLVIESGLDEVLRWGRISILLRKVSRVRVSGAPQRYVQLGLVSRPQVLSAISPALWWWVQTMTWWSAPTISGDAEKGNPGTVR